MRFVVLRLGRVGTILLAVNHLDTWGWLVMAPASLFMLYLLIGL